MTRLGGAVAGVTVASGVGMILTALAGLYVVRVLPISDYGRLVYFLSAFGLFRLLGSLGIDNKVINDLPVHAAYQRFAQLNTCFYSLLGLRVLTGTLVLAVGSVAALIQNDDLLFYATLTALGAVIADFCMSGMAGLQRTIQQIIAFLSQPLIYAIGVAAFLFINPTAHQAAWLLTSSFLLSAIVGTCLLAGPPLTRPSLPLFSWCEIKAAFTFTGAAILGTLLRFVIFQGPILALGQRHLYEEAALLGVVLSLLLVPSELWVLAIVRAYYPRLRLAQAQEQTQAVSQIFGRLFLAMGLINLIAMFISSSIPGPLLHILYGPKYAASSMLLSLSAPSMLLMPYDALLTFTLLGLGRHRAMLAVLGLQNALLTLAITSIVIAPVTDKAAWIVIGLLASTVVAVVLKAWMLRHLLSASWCSAHLRLRDWLRSSGAAGYVPGLVGRSR